MAIVNPTPEQQEEINTIVKKLEEVIELLSPYLQTWAGNIIMQKIKEAGHWTNEVILSHKKSEEKASEIVSEEIIESPIIESVQY